MEWELRNGRFQHVNKTRKSKKKAILEVVDEAAASSFLQRELRNLEQNEERYMELVRQQSHEEVATAAVTSSLKLWRAPMRVELQNIIDSIKKSVTLNKVDFYNNSFTSAADVAAICDAIAENTSIAEVNFCRTGMGDAGARSLSHMLIRRRHGMVTKRIVDQFHASKQHKTDVDAVNARLLGQKNLETVRISHNKIGGSGACLIAAALAQQSTVVEMDLASNGIDGNGGSSIFSALRENMHLKRLRMCNNPLGSKSCAHFAKSLEHNASLIEIDLAGCELGSLGASKILNSLSENATLKSLSLANNRITKEFADSLSSLRENHGLCSLSLQANPIQGVEPWRVLAKVLRENDTLEHLHTWSLTVSATIKGLDVIDYIPEEEYDVAKLLLDALKNNRDTQLRDLEGFRLYNKCNSGKQDYLDNAHLLRDISSSVTVREISLSVLANTAKPRRGARRKIRDRVAISNNHPAYVGKVRAENKRLRMKIRQLEALSMRDGAAVQTASAGHE
eukprot:g1435.t1